MIDKKTNRRSLIGAGALIAGGSLVSVPAMAAEPKPKAWQPAVEQQDLWMDIPGTAHRIVWDTSTAKGFSDAAAYAGNFYVANKLGYGLEAKSLGVILIARSRSTPFAYNSSIWAKYGAMFAGILKLEGDEAEHAKTANPLLVDGKEGADTSTLGHLIGLGTRFAVCGLATKGIAGHIAKEVDKSADPIEADLRANLIPGGTMVAAGVVAINRAQEFGYTFAVTE